ncbi:hypothetical protein DFH09DRAFT_1288605 [Mycena vulgaris]|nr:hypothetical protein DFH09DRAFT_1288580 [Mycena vulgaris]KAJ6511255.1 hypothetical protein DFH09DRAFT_1288605 [Mycena vulgaris]
MSSPSPFIPTSRDVLLLISANAMRGGGLRAAFVFNRGPGVGQATGLVIDEHGSMCEVGAEEWAELQHLVSEASDAVMDGGGGSWMRHSTGSCAPNVFYDLGPAEEPAALGMFTISGHRREKQDISHKMHGVFESVCEIPSAFLQLERASSAIQRKLLPYEHSRTQNIPLSDNLERETGDGGCDCQHVNRRPIQKVDAASVNERVACLVCRVILCFLPRMSALRHMYLQLLQADAI